MPAFQDFSNIINQAQQAYNPKAIQDYYNMAMGGLNRNAGNAGAMAGRMAGAHTTNMLNPSSFIMQQYSKSQEPYAQQYGNLQQAGAGAKMKGASDLTNLLFQINRAQSSDYFNQQQLDAQQASPFSQILAPVTGFLGSEAGSRFLFPSTYKKY